MKNLLTNSTTKFIMRENKDVFPFTQKIIIFTGKAYALGYT